MNKKTSEWIDGHKEEIIKTLQKTISYPSVKNLSVFPATKDAPFGQPIRDCLDYVLGLGESMGFNVKNLDGYCGYIEFGEGDEELAVLAHLDVVPEGSGWTHPPFGGEIAQGRLWGRGALDDKGPAIACLYSMAAMKECGIRPSRRIRLVLGCDEESGMECIEHYNSVCPAPDLCFSPDADFPLVNSEMNIYQAEYRKMYPSGICFKAGTAGNVAAPFASCDLPLTENEVLSFYKENNYEGFTFEISSGDQGHCHLEIKGKAAHASTPALGKNAIYAGLDFLSKLPLSTQDHETLCALHDLLSFKHYGESFGLERQDVSGRLVMNIGLLDWDSDGIKSMSVDVRAPISTKEEEITMALRLGFKKAGLSEVESSMSEGYHVPEDSELVQKLLKVYREYFNDGAGPVATGGGTYARHIQNAVAFGPERPGVEAPIHMPDEFIDLDYLIEDCKIYADAMIELTTL